MTNEACFSSTPSWEGLKELGNQAFKNSYFDEAIGYYSKAIEIKLDEAALYSNRSAAFLKKGEFKRAAEDARMAIEVDKTFVKAYSRLHNALCNLANFSQGAEEMKNGLSAIAIASMSGSTTLQDTMHLKELQTSAEVADQAFQRAKQLFTVGDLQGAGRAIANTIRQFPDCAPVIFMAVECSAAADPEHANNLLSNFNYSHDSDLHYLYLRALILYYRGQMCFENSKNILRHILELDPDDNRAGTLLKKIRAIEKHKETGNAFFKQKRPREAIEEYTVAIDIDLSNTHVVATLRGNRAAAFMDIHDFKKAMLDCDYAINNGAASGKLYARRSRVHESLDQFDDALRDMQQAAKADNNFAAELRQLKVRVKRSKRKDYYKILGLKANESDDNVIKRAYKKACLQWHPDKWAHASEEEKVYAEKQFKEVGEAFGVLSNPQKKRLYDSGQINNDVEGACPASEGFAPSHDDMINIMNMMFSRGDCSFQEATFRRGEGKQSRNNGSTRYTYFKF